MHIAPAAECLTLSFVRLSWFINTTCKQGYIFAHCLGGGFAYENLESASCWQVRAAATVGMTPTCIVESVGNTSLACKVRTGDRIAVHSFLSTVGGDDSKLHLQNPILLLRCSWCALHEQCLTLLLRCFVEFAGHHLVQPRVHRRLQCHVQFRVHCWLGRVRTLLLNSSSLHPDSVSHVQGCRDGSLPFSETLRMASPWGQSFRAATPHMASPGRDTVGIAHRSLQPPVNGSSPEFFYKLECHRLTCLSVFC